VVVATQGRRDVQGLRLALALQARQVSMVASGRKAGVLKQSLVASGADSTAVAAIVAPAGYPMAATTPQEIALSVLAAVVAERRGALTARASAVEPVTATSAAVPEAVNSATTLAAAPAPAAKAAAPLPELAVTSSCCGGGMDATALQPAEPARALSAADETAAARAALALPVVKSSCCGG
jgi:xanthine dehydrogenase accessory factor